MAGFHVDELKADFVREAGGGDVVVDQPFQIVVGPDDALIVRIDVELCIEQRMMVGDPRFEAFIVRAREAAGVGELQADEQIVVGAERFAMGVAAGGQQIGQAVAVARRGERLIGIRPAVGLHGGRFAAPDQLGAAQAEVPPAAQRVRRRRAIAVGVPAFHRMDAPAIADREPADV